MSIHRKILNPRLISLFLLSCSLAGKAQESEFDQRVDGFVGNHIQLQTLLSKLQQSVATHDARTVAAMVHYPIRVAPQGRAVVIRTAAEFIAKYDFVMTSDIREAIRKQKYEDMFVRDQGAMIGDGQVWFAGYCQNKACKDPDIRIKTIQAVAGLGK